MVKVKRTTIRDVAKESGVSPSTVSMVLNNSDRSFTNEVRKRVLKAVKTLKYQPGNVGRPCSGEIKRQSLNLKEKVVLLISSPYNSVSGSIYGMVHKGAEFELKSHKIDLVVQNTESFMLMAEAVGVIYFSPSSKEKDKLIGKKASAVCMGCLDKFSHHDHVTYMNSQIGVLAAEYLLKKGHTHAGCMPMVNSTIFGTRTETFAKVITRAGKKCSHSIPTDHANLFDDPANLEKVLVEYFSRPDPPTALFIPADTVTSIAYPLLYSMGVIPGRDVEVVTCNNEFLRIAGLTPRPTVIDIKAFDVGRMAAVQLLNRIKHPEVSPVKLELMPIIIDGSEWDNYIKQEFYYR